MKIQYTVASAKDNKGFMKKFALKGDIVYAKDSQTLQIHKNSYVLCNGKYCAGIVQAIEKNPLFKNAPVYDYSGCLILPSIVDLHVHAPQYRFRGIGMDLPLLDWLNTYTFPEEAQYQNTEYALHAYQDFVNNLQKSATTRAVVFATIHLESSIILAKMFEKTGLGILLGKVNMDRNCPETLQETVTQSLQNTELFIKTLESFTNVKPIITPRFIPSCSSDLLYGLGKLTAQYNLPVQSHLSENKAEIEWVKSLHPKSSCYADVYNQYGLLNNATVMAHCVHSPQNEQKLLHEKQTFIAHCPQSNTNLLSGIAPISEYLQKGLLVGLGTDVAGGASLNMFRAADDAIAVSKMRSVLLKEHITPNDFLSPNEAFYMMTVGGGKFFETATGEKLGKFEKNYCFDAVIIDDTHFSVQKKQLFSEYTIQNRLERLLHIGNEHTIRAKYVNGALVYEKS